MIIVSRHPKKHWALRKKSALSKIFIYEEDFFDQKSCPLSKGQINTIVRTTLNMVGLSQKIDLEMSFISKEKIQAANHSFRQKNQPTNILSFGGDDLQSPSSRKIPKFLGELLLSPDIIFEEARNFNISLAHRWMHLIVHGTLHLLNYDHEKDNERTIMEALEKKILSLFNISDPYVINE